MNFLYYTYSPLETEDMAHEAHKHLTEMSRQTDMRTEGGGFYFSFQLYREGMGETRWASRTSYDW